MGRDDRGEAEARTSCASAWNTWLGGARIEIAGRLVGQQHARRVGDRARDRDALLLAAGKLRRAVFEALLQAEIAQQLVGALARLPCARGRGSSAAASTFSTAENSGSRWWN